MVSTLTIKPEVTLRSTQRADALSENPADARDAADRVRQRETQRNGDKCGQPKIGQFRSGRQERVQTDGNADQHRCVDDVDGEGVPGQVSAKSTLAPRNTPEKAQQRK